MYMWLNKRSAIVWNIRNKQRKKLTNILVQIDQRRSQVEAAQFCFPPATCKNELAYLHEKKKIHEIKQPHQNPF